MLKNKLPLTILVVACTLLLPATLLAQKASASGPLSSKTVDITVDTIRGTLSVKSDKKSKHFVGEHAIWNAEGEHTLVRIISNKVDLAITMISPGEKKGIVKMDQRRGDAPSKPSYIDLKLPESKPGEYIIRVSSQAEYQTGDYMIEIIRASGSLSLVPTTASLCDKLDAVLGYRSIDFMGLKGKRLKEDRLRGHYTHTTYLHMVDDKRAHVFDTGEELYYESVINETNYPAIATEVYEEHLELMKTCFQEWPKEVWVENSTGSRGRPYKEFYAGESLETAMIALTLEQPSRRSDDFLVVIRIREPQKKQ